MIFMIFNLAHFKYELKLAHATAVGRWVGGGSWRRTVLVLEAACRRRAVRLTTRI